MICSKHRYTYLYNDTDPCQYCEIDRLKELNTKYLTEICALHEKLAEQVRSCNEAWSEATGGNYPAHAEKIIEALRSSVQFWKDETRRSVESGDLAYAKAMRLYATMVAENEELKETVKQVEQSAINFHDAWQQALNDLESVRAENAELRNINQSLSVNYVKYKDMKGALEFFARLKQDMLIVDINRIANAALHNTIEEPI